MSMESESCFGKEFIQSDFILEAFKLKGDFLTYLNVIIERIIQFHITEHSKHTIKTGLNSVISIDIESGTRNIWKVIDENLFT